MAKSTRLYQRAQSPLIQGRSKRERPMWQPFVGAFIVATVAPLALWWFIVVLGGAQPAEAVIVLFSDIFSILVRTVPGALIGAAVGVLGARAWGSRRPWLPGAIFGGLLALAGLLFFG